MIRSLAGTVSYHVPGGIILEVGGIGYLVAVPLRSTPLTGASVTLFTHHHVREQDQSLYGFTTLAELVAFEQLLAVSGIGPKSALTVLSVATPVELEKAIDADDVGFFAAVPGIGKKTAAKIIVELKGKLASTESLGSSELRNALNSLGYNSRDVEPLLRTLPADLTDTQTQLRWLLKQFSK